MTMLKFCAVMMAFVIAIVFPPLAIPLIAFIWITIDRHRKKVAALNQAITTVEREKREAERYKILRSI